VKSWVNGVEGGAVGTLDRGLNYGDGLFETMRLERGAVRHLARHLARLAEGCTRLGLKRLDFEQLRREIDDAARTVADGTLKLVVTRGSGARGYRPAGDELPARILTWAPARESDPAWAIAGVRVRYCQTPATQNSALAGMKHLNRLDCVLARREWSDPETVEGLMRDSHGRIVGGTMTNLFAVRGRTLLTPSIEDCGVRGIMRAVVIDAARGSGISVVEVGLSADDLAQADELFLTNALIGVWPVRLLEARRYAIGATTVRLRETCAAVADPAV